MAMSVTIPAVPGGKGLLRFLQGDTIRICLLISIGLHLLLLIGIPPLHRRAIPVTEPIAVQLLAPHAPSRPPKPEPEHKTAAVGRKSQRPVIRPKPETKKDAVVKPAVEPAPVRLPEKEARKPAPVHLPEKEARKPAKKPQAPDTAAAVSRIRTRLNQEQRQQRLAEIRRDLQPHPQQPAATAASSAAARVFLHRYAAQVKRRITDHWHLPEHLSNDTLQATVIMVIDAAGNLESVKLSVSSGNRLFDASVLRAIEASAPFPPLPAHLEIPREEFVIDFDPLAMKSR
jgi:TonB family protein